MTAQETTTGSVIADRSDLKQRLERQRRLHPSLRWRRMRNARAARTPSAAARRGAAPWRAISASASRERDETQRLRSDARETSGRRA